MTDKEKIRKYLDSKGISRNKFYTTTGLSVGFLDSGSSLGLDKLRIIIGSYPDLSINWLMKDEGSMFADISHSDKSNLVNDPEPRYDSKPLEARGYSKSAFVDAMLQLQEENTAEERKSLVRQALSMHSKLEETHEELLKDFLGVLSRRK